MWSSFDVCPMRIASLMLTVAVWHGVAAASQHRKPAGTATAGGDHTAHDAKKRGGNVSGIFIARGDDWITFKADGEKEPQKYVVDPADKDLQETFKHVFHAARAQLTYKQSGDARQLVGIKRHVIKPTGTITGEVVKVYDNFWVEIKPKTGLPDAFAPGANYNDKAFMETLRGLQSGDSVTIKYNTDFERHRILSLRVNRRKAPPKTGEPASKDGDETGR